MIALKNVTHDFGRGPVLRDVSLSISPGEFLCVVGSSSSGKSTLLSLLTGAIAPAKGSVVVDGADLQTVPAGALQIFRRKLGIVFQDFKLLQTRTVAENIAMNLEIAGMDDAAIEKRVQELLKKMELTHCADALPKELSRGEMARVAVARAIAHAPLIVIADEPAQNLDMRQAAAILRTLRDLNAEGSTVILATHDAVLVESLKARVVVLENGMIAKDEAMQQKKDIMTKKKDAVLVEALPERQASPAVKAQRRVKITAIRSE